MELAAAALVGVLAGLLAAALAFAAVARSRRSDVTEERLRTLEQGIDAGLREVRDSVTRVAQVVHDVDGARGESIANLAAVVRESQRQVDTLSSSASRLTTLLGGNQARGQWGERVADDILRAAGFVDGVNYERNRRVDGGATRPDFTFRLPEGRVLHMDVKFPLANYARYVEAVDDVDRQAALRQFLADVRTSVKSVTTREYIDPEGGTLDFVLLFIPNEQVYGFIHEHDARLVDDALAQRVVLCSPLSLFAVLAVIRRAADALAFEQHADEIVRALGAFSAQWIRYRDAIDTVARRLDSAQKALDDVRGVRTRQLERQMDRVEQLRLEAGIELDAEPLPDDEEPASVEPV